jgi:hypothetical protein
MFGRPELLSSELRLLMATERELEPEAPEVRRRVLARVRRSVPDPRALLGNVSLWRRARWAPVVVILPMLASVCFAAWHDSGAPWHEGEVLIARGGAANDLPRWKPPSASMGPQGPFAEAEADSSPRPGRARQAAPSTHAHAHALELELLQRARLLLARGEFTAASRATAEHRRRFPSSPLREERDALRIRALDGLGRTTEARRATVEFRQRYPKSVLSPRAEGSPQ